MVINYCFTVYNEPELLRHTILRLQHSNARFFIHVDKRVDEDVFREALQNIDNVMFIKNRVASQWADISTVKAIMGLLRAAIADGEKGYCVVLSGQDYPIKSAEYIYDYFFGAYPKQFIHAESEENWDRHLKHWMYSHIYSHWISLIGKTKIIIKPYRFFKLYALGTLTWRDAPALLRRLFSFHTMNRIWKCYTTPRVVPSSFTIYASETWFQITNEAATYALAYLDSHSDLYDFYETFGFPEESLLQSIILSNVELHAQWHGDFLSYVNRNSSDASDSLRLTNESLTSMQWAIKNPDKLFIRKVFWEDQDVIEFIDNIICGNNVAQL